MTRTLHVSLGPVQDFIEQARRTRDLWAGSFLLSWLSGTAMKAVTDKGGAIVFPVVDHDPLFNALHKRTVAGQAAWPFIGTLPNRFKATVPDGFDALGVAETVRCAWRDLAQAVWSVFLDGIATPRTAEIWHRQIDDFWQVSWVFEDGHPEFDGLGRRKLWRTAALPPDEGGDHCTIMGDWQEVSGFVRAQGRAKDQDAFWDTVRNRINRAIYGKSKEIGALELRRSERLCAIALVKRLFPLLPLTALEGTIGWVPDMPVDWPVDGRDKELHCQLRKYPSTAYMAAVPWMLNAWQVDEKKCEDYAGKVETVWPGAAPGILTRAERFSAVQGLAKTSFGDVDGTLFFHNGIARRRAEMRTNQPTADDGEAAEVKALTNALQALQNATAPTGGRRQEKMREASPFYALLIMDGDHMGELLKKNAPAVSKALAVFTDRVRGIVRDANGLLLYAGGDDVLALLPVHTALATAESLSTAFRRSFKEKMPDRPATISAGLVFAHYSAPLGNVLRQAHDALDDTAKEANGRDSLAVVVLKPGGAVAEWVSAWELEKDGGPSAAGAVGELVTEFAEDDERSSAFLYHLSERYCDLLEHLSTEELDTNLVNLLLAERLKGKDLASVHDVEKRDGLREKARKEMMELAAVCRPRRKNTGARPFDIDGALLVKFLADNGGWFKGGRS